MQLAFSASHLPDNGYEAATLVMLQDPVPPWSRISFFHDIAFIIRPSSGEEPGEPKKGSEPGASQSQRLPRHYCQKRQEDRNGRRRSTNAPLLNASAHGFALSTEAEEGRVRR